MWDLVKQSVADGYVVCVGIEFSVANISWSSMVLHSQRTLAFDMQRGGLSWTRPNIHSNNSEINVTLFPCYSLATSLAYCLWISDGNPKTFGFC